ncbi:putative Phosphonate ABC transporter,periplasmic [Vibrio nigripulchritudo SO65]|uniref:phosphate/phosphite/phosphonate ABC transporter substrate-binding protein n=1 Tax=Vibrio nigripulchritudo TaxID=28173 RepID=UPI0003B23D98|nr:phosphate/phosphite/phosphonate ABC transporter substrate-binding protein [Vibrio nigripulchritudo]CCN35625.1 putative Phosphonate ABC transporter,periplasmic [Vibrio nigripulchritudo AM115]CCN44512.1 putative Phosphonate ABC transporter,periplasmic [Vibrio nigripulchritudo FTn2]CCN67785.1 putative Phosphonate ABC transporter,periplasmic [Vibrio nigripulchritudo POn4]CCN77189.1 putative Phosphonate ABC transporter,periplasmic [Vibrio nigripulchritudo SO65]
MKLAYKGLLIATSLLLPSVALADTCNHKGVLDDRYCDENNDLVADTPKNKDNWRDPSTLVFTYTPVEDPAIYKDAFADFQEHLSKITGKRVIYYTVHSNSAQVEAMRSGRLHVAGFSTGPTGYAVNLAGYVPIAVKGDENGFQGYNLITIVRKDSGINTMDDLKGKRVAHTSASSNSGNLAPRALFPSKGITPDKDYKVLYSGKHDQSILGVFNGDYDAAPVASDVYDRMVDAGRVDADKLKIIYRSPRFPTSAFGYSHDLNPDLVAKIKEAFSTYRFTPEMSATFKGADRFSPITYKEEWEVIRNIAHATGTAYTKTGLKKLAEKEAAKRAKKKAAELAKQANN